jgi:hypothetical protein
VGPVFVTVDAPRTANWAAVPSGTGAVAAAAPALAGPAAHRRTADAPAIVTARGNRREVVILRMAPATKIMGFLPITMRLTERLNLIFNL